MAKRKLNVLDPATTVTGSNHLPIEQGDGNTKRISASALAVAFLSLQVGKTAKVASTGNLTLSGEQTIDGVAAAATDTVLAKDQSTSSQNGLYTVAVGAWSRATTMDAWSEVPGAIIAVEQGTTNADTLWLSTADQGGTLGTTAITFAQQTGTKLYQPYSNKLVRLTQLTWADGKYPIFTGANTLSSGEIAPYSAGRFFAGFSGPTGGTTAVTTLDTVIYLVPFIVRRAVAITSLNIRIVTGAATSAVKMGVWASNSTTGKPTGVPVAASNTGQSCATNGTTPTVAVSATLQPAQYWYGCAFTTAAPQATAIGNNDSTLSALFGRSAVGANTSLSGLSAPFTYSNDITALDLTAATLTDVLGANGVPVMFFGT